MDTQNFLSKVLSDDGFYCVVGFKDGKPSQKFFSTLDSVMASASTFERSGHDVFFALGTFVTEGRRNASNVKYLKAFFLDLDCGDGKGYPTKDEAIVSLRSFRKHYNLPFWTRVVSSGSGLHVYWVLEKAVSFAEWKPVADQLKQACVDFEFDVDPAPTADGARILRLPGSLNHKSDPPKPTGFLGKENGLVSFEHFKSCLPVSLIPVSSRTYSDHDRATMEAAMSNKHKRFTRLLDGTYAEGEECLQLIRAVTHPADLTYNQWLATLSIVKFCVESPELAHEISKDYPAYTASETDTVLASIESPFYCTTFEGYHPEGCEGCVHKGLYNSPISLCIEVKEAPVQSDVVEVQNQITKPDPKPDPNPNLLTPALNVYTIPDYPGDYFRGADGGIYLRTLDKKKKPTEILVYRQPLYPVRRLVDPQRGPCYVFRHHTAREGIREFVGVGTDLSSPEGFRNLMGINDVFLLREDLGNLMTYVKKWIIELQDNMDEINVRTQFGWTEDYASFVVGDKEIFGAHTSANPPGARTAQYFPYFKSKGTLEGWKKVTAFYNRPEFEEHQYMFGLSFGSPLMEFVPNIAGAIYHLTSADSGYGKTTGMFAGASVWGNHKRLVLKGKDTGNSIWNRAEIYKNIVLYVDELSNLEAKEASNFAYAVSDGEQRNRQSNSPNNEERFRGDEWSFLVGSTGNASLLDKIIKHRSLPKGEAQRVMESTVTKKLNSSDQTVLARELNENLANNYGHAGEIYIRHVINNLDSVKKSLNENIANIIEDAGLDSQNRFWSAKAGANFTGVMIAQHLELIDWDIEAFYAWIIAKLKRMKNDMKDMEIDIGDLVGQFYQAHPRGFLRVKSTDDSRIGDSDDTYVSTDNSPMFQWVGRLEYDVNKLYILPKPFKEWLVAHGHHYSGIRSLIKKEMGGRSTKIRLGRGSKVDLPTQHVIEMSWNHDKYMASVPKDASLFPDKDDD